MLRSPGLCFLESHARKLRFALVSSEVRCRKNSSNLEQSMIIRITCIFSPFSGSVEPLCWDWPCSIYRVLLLMQSITLRDRQSRHQISSLLLQTRSSVGIPELPEDARSHVDCGETYLFICHGPISSINDASQFSLCTDKPLVT